MLELKVDIIQLLIISAIINGFVFSILLLWKKENSKANPFLSLLLFSFSFTVLTSVILKYGLYNQFPDLHWLPFTMTFWIGPAFFFYIKCLIQPNFEFKRSHWWHFSPIVLNYTHSIYHLIYGRTFPHPLIHNFTEAVGTYALVTVFLYLILAYKDLTKYQASIVNQLSAIDDVQLNWIKQIIKTLALVFVVIAVFKMVDYEELIDYSVESSEGLLFPYRDFIQLSLSFGIYWLAIGGFKQMQIINNPTAETTEKQNDKDYSEIVEKLMEVMKSKHLYRDPALTLKTLSEKTHLPARDISIGINQSLNKNFYNFVNEYRVEEAKEKLADAQYQHLKILSIAFDCGFNSKASFNRIFKEFTGRSPKQFRAS